MKRLSAAAVFAVALAPAPTHAADLFGTAPPPVLAQDAGAPQVEVGSNWYIRGDVGVSVDNAPTISFATISTPPQGNASTPWSPVIGTNTTKADPTFDIGFGYRFNNWFRLEATYDYRSGPGGSNTSTVICPYGVYGVTAQNPDAAGVYIQYGYLYNPTNTCNGLLNVTQRNNMGLVSGYADLGTWWGFTPYVGGGVGVNANTMSGSLNYVQTSNGQGYAADLTPNGTFPQIWVNNNGSQVSPQPNIAFAPQNWNRTISSTKYTMAWAVMLGFGYQITPSATIDIGYRYLNTGTNNTLVNPNTNAVVKQTNSSQQFRIGIRYMAD